MYAATANGCRPVPRPLDTDGDGRPDATDACPTERAATANGCPLPALTSLSVTVRRRSGRRSVAVKAGTSRPATVRVIVERRKDGRWVRVKHATLAAANRATVRVGRVRRGRYRVRVAVWNDAGAGVPAAKRFRVR